MTPLDVIKARVPGAPHLNISAITSGGVRAFGNVLYYRSKSGNHMQTYSFHDNLLCCA